MGATHTGQCSTTAGGRDACGELNRVTLASPKPAPSAPVHVAPETGAPPVVQPRPDPEGPDTPSTASFRVEPRCCSANPGALVPGRPGWWSAGAPAVRSVEVAGSFFVHGSSILPLLFISCGAFNHDRASGGQRESERLHP